MKLYLNPKALDAIKTLQNGTEQYTALLEDTVDYIIDTADVLDPNIDGRHAISLLRYLRELSNIIKDLEEIES